MFLETHKRSILKAISWRCFGSLFTGLAGWIVTSSIRVGVTIGVVDFLIKVGTFYVHERIWQKIRWGIFELDGDTKNGGGI